MFLYLVEALATKRPLAWLQQHTLLLRILDPNRRLHFSLAA